MTLVVAFDLDGTLIDTPRAIVETFAAAFVAMGEPPRGASVIRSTIGLPLEQAFGKLLGLPTNDIRVAEGVRQYQIHFRELVLPRGRALVFPGVVDGLATLRARGMVLTVATSKFHASAEALLRAANLWEEFSLVVGADQVTRPKPDPEMGRLIMRELRVTADRVVMVGDTTHDLLMAKAAGVRGIAVSYGIHTVPKLRSVGPLMVADTFAEVVTCLSHLDNPLHEGVRDDPIHRG